MSSHDPPSAKYNEANHDPPVEAGSAWSSAGRRSLVELGRPPHATLWVAELRCVARLARLEQRHHESLLLDLRERSSLGHGEQPCRVLPVAPFGLSLFRREGRIPSRSVSAGKSVSTSCLRRRNTASTRRENCTGEVCRAPLLGGPPAFSSRDSRIAGSTRKQGEAHARAS